MLPTILILFGIFFISQYSEIVIGTIYILGAFIWIGLFPRWFRWNMKKGVLITHKDKNKSFFQKTITLSADGLISKTDFGESKIQWSAIERIEKLEAYILMYLAPMDAFIIPRRAFESEDLMANFYETALKLKNLFAA